MGEPFQEHSIFGDPIIERDVVQLEIFETRSHNTSLYIQPHGGLVKFWADQFGSWFKFNTADRRRGVVMPVERLAAVEYGHPFKLDES
jgi:hypothetical protein